MGPSTPRCLAGVVRYDTGPAVKTSTPDLPPCGAAAPLVAIESGLSIPAAGPAQFRQYSELGHFTSEIARIRATPDRTLAARSDDVD